MGRLAHETSWEKIASLLAETRRLQESLSSLARQIDWEMRRLREANKKRTESAVVRLKQARQKQKQLARALKAKDQTLRETQVVTAIRHSPAPPSLSKYRDAAGRHLPPRLRETLGHLLTGCSEKQVAYKMKISRNTVHVYIKLLYQRSNVNSRSELLVFYLGNGSRQRVNDDDK